MLWTTIDCKNFSYKDNIDKDNQKLKSYYSSFEKGFTASPNIDAPGLYKSKSHFDKKQMFQCFKLNLPWNISDSADMI